MRVNERCPYVAIAEPLTADSVKLSRLRRRSEQVGGIILTCAPVSMRKLHLLIRSVMCNRRHMWPDTSVATNGWPGRLAAECNCRVECTSLPCYHTFGGTSKLFALEGLGCGADFGIGNDLKTVE